MQELIENFVMDLNNKYPKIEIYDECFIYTVGGRYYKICKSKDGASATSVYAFVDKNTGDLYKAASFAAPAKHIRGNIMNESGLNACNKYSVQSLK